MPVQKYSAMDPGGTWVDDARDTSARWNAQRGDQWAQFNTNLANQRSQDDWRREVALKQLGLTREMGLWGREDAATARQMEADRYGKQFDYMSMRDKTMDERMAARDAAANEQWRQTFDLSKGGIEEERKYRAQEMADREAERMRRRPLEDTQAEVAKMELERMRAQAAARTGASAAAAYAPTTDEGREAYQATLAVSGDQLQAGMAAKSAERERSAQQAAIAKQQLEATLQDFSAKDTAIIGWDPSPQDQQNVIKQAEALKVLLERSGMKADEAAATVANILRQNLTSGGRTDINAGLSEDILNRFGSSYR